MKLLRSRTRRVYFLSLAALLLSMPARGTDIASCFNDNDSNGRIGFWAYEGHTDWKAARIALPPTFVFSFALGREEYGVSDLRYCFYMPKVKAGEIARCKTGSLRLTRVDIPKVV